MSVSESLLSYKTSSNLSTSASVPFVQFKHLKRSVHTTEFFLHLHRCVEQSKSPSLPLYFVFGVSWDLSKTFYIKCSRGIFQRFFILCCLFCWLWEDRTKFRVENIYQVMIIFVCQIIWFQGYKTPTKFTLQDFVVNFWWIVIHFDPLSLQVTLSLHKTCVSYWLS